MGFLDELKKLTRPYPDDEDDYMDDAERIDDPEPERPVVRANPFSTLTNPNPAPAPDPAPAAPIRPFRPRLWQAF